VQNAPLVSEANVSAANVSVATSMVSVATSMVSEATSMVSVADSVPKAINTEALGFIQEKSETVLINSNFRCGYYINREKLYNLLKYKYKIF
jgi:hypothetical protein